MSERGSAPVEMALGVLVLIVPAVFLVLSFGPLLEHRNDVRRVAAESARAYVLSEGEVEAAFEVLSSLGEFKVGFCDEPAEPRQARSMCEFGRSGHVEVVVEAPAVVSFFGDRTVTVSWRHREPIDPYRSR